MIDESGSSGVQIKDALKQAYSTLHKIQNKDWERRQEFLNNLAEKYASENKIPKELAIKALMHHEELRELFRHIRIKMKGMRTPQLSEIWTTDEVQEKHIITGSREVEEHLLQRNWSQLRQAANTPFAEGEFADDIRWDGTGDMADRMVEGMSLPKI